jgi:hypothetical protein
LPAGILKFALKASSPKNQENNISVCYQITSKDLLIALKLINRLRLKAKKRATAADNHGKRKEESAKEKSR